MPSDQSRCPHCQQLIDKQPPPPVPEASAASLHPELIVNTAQPRDDSFTRFAKRDQRRFGMLLRRIPTVICVAGLIIGVLVFLNRQPRQPNRDLLRIAPTPTAPPRTAASGRRETDRSAVLHAIDEVVVCIETGRPEQPTTLGAGLIVDESGLVATNYHVTAEATELRVRFRSGAYFEIAGYAAVSPENDLALLQIADPPPNLAPLPMRTSAPAPLTSVYAIGHPHGVKFSVYSGKVSRSVATSELSENSRRFLERHLNGVFEHEWIQHTATISEGNSGGPLLTATGEVAGINTWINRQTGFCYALDASYLKRLLAERLPETAPLERFASKQARVAASLQRLSAVRIRRLWEEAQAMRYRPESENGYAALQELAWVIALTQLPADQFSRPSELSEAALDDLSKIAIQIEADLRRQNWNDLGTITLVNEFAAGQVAKPLAGAFFFCTIDRSFSGDNGARGALARLAGFDQAVFLRLDSQLTELQPGEHCLVVGVNQNGRVVRYGDNPLRLNIAPEIAVGLIVAMKP